MTITTVTKIKTFYNICFRHIFNIQMPERITNQELWKRAGQETMDIQTRQKKWGWIGHTPSKPTPHIKPCTRTHRAKGSGDIRETTGGGTRRKPRTVFIGGLSLMAYVPHETTGLCK